MAAQAAQMRHGRWLAVRVGTSARVTTHGTGELAAVLTVAPCLVYTQSFRQFFEHSSLCDVLATVAWLCMS
jgi:hypothetical protein